MHPVSRDMQKGYFWHMQRAKPQIQIGAPIQSGQNVLLFCTHHVWTQRHTQKMKAIAKLNRFKNWYFKQPLCVA